MSESVFPGDGSDVRVVMLDENEGKPLFGRLPGGFAGGEKVGMPVAGEGFGRHVEELEKMRDGRLERRARLRRIGVADVFREKSLGAARDAGRVFKKSAPGDDVGPLGNRETQRCQTSGAADGAHDVRRISHDGVVAARDDGAVVKKKCVGNTGKTFIGFAVVRHQRVACGISARHDENVGISGVGKASDGTPCGFKKKEQMYRGVGEHQADFSVTGGNGGRNQAAAVVRFRREHDGVRR